MSAVHVAVLDDVGECVGDKEAEIIIDADIDEFEQWFCSEVDTSTIKLSNIERSIIKTFLYWKTQYEKTSLEVESGENPTG